MTAQTGRLPRESQDFSARPPSVGMGPALSHDHVILALIFGSMMLFSYTSLFITPGDVFVVAYVGFLVIAAPSFMPSLSHLRPLAIPLYLFTVAGFLALAGDDGLTQWALVAVARDFMALLWFIAGFAYARMTTWDRERIASVIAFFMALEMAVLAATYVGYRSGGTFPNPNYAAHFTMVLAVTSFVLTDRRSVRVLAVVCGLGGVIATGSFGLIVGMAVAGLFGAAYSRQGRSSISTRMMYLALAGLAGVAVLLALRQNADVADFALSESLNTTRLDRSGGTRIDIWSVALDAWKQDLLGLGPEGVTAKDVLVAAKGSVETHSDFVTTLVERGVLGLIALLMMPFALLRSSKNRASLPIVLVAVLVAAVFRDTLHYRHSALILGLLVSIPHLRGRHDQQPPRAA